MLDVMACPICKGYPLELEIREGKDNAIIEGVINCPSCGRKYFINEGIPCMLPDELREKAQKLHLKLDSKPKMDFNKWSEKQDIYLNWLKSEWERMDLSDEIRIKTKESQERFFNYLKTKGSVLDIGCERGKMRQYSTENDYFGIDPMNPVSEGLIEKIKFPFIQCVGEYLPFKDNVFENVLIMSVLDHTASPLLVLKESCRVLKKSGYMLISSPLEGENLVKKGIIRVLKGDIRSVIKFFFRSGDTHLHHFTTGGLIKLVSQYFDKIETKKDFEGILFIRGQK